ncbi:TIR domain-containing protein [Lentzea atacamensis]|uniref:TIR domain-containing protein n=1 Tax=Lentzea atacamensis TaxID=531938 RepID=A0ABX9DXH0_9PSEU|nr:TIR domain-containing protein [Lentzea atacamensis]
MNVFVSYSRRDNEQTLLEIERLISWGTPYIDDLHHSRHGGDRHEAVEFALRASQEFVAVLSPSYLRTPWTRWEFGWAVESGIPMVALIGNSKLVPINEEMKYRLLNDLTALAA